MLEWFKTGFGIGLGVIAAALVFLTVLGLWDWLDLCVRKLRLTMRHRKT